MPAERHPSTGEWSVLGLLSEEPAHGWALAAALAPDGEIGAVWSLSKPLVYRALELLRQQGLVEEAGPASSTRGPSRTLFRPTRKGRTALARWLREPVSHIRDLRPDLVLKLIFLQRAGRDTTELLTAQRSLVAALLGDLEERLEAARAEQAVLLRYRVEVARAALRFVEAEELVG
jgi:DNA-binding PadR family transcriptional regulator